MINYRKGNMFDHVPDNKDSTVLFLHGVNCQGVMGSGVAKEFKERFPEAFERYLEDLFRPRSAEDPLLGSLSNWSDYDSDYRKYYISGFTQIYYGRAAKRYASYAAIFSVLMKTFKYAHFLSYEGENTDIVMPKIGCGLGGCDWKYIEPVVEALSLEYPNISAYVYEL